MKKLLLSVSTLLCVAPAFAGLKEGVVAYEKEDWATAVAELTQVADNSPEAAELLSDYYYYYYSARADDRTGKTDQTEENAQTVKWSLVAAKRGDVKTQYDMGVRIDDIAWRSSRYLADTKKNRYFQSAADCFKMAADQGYAPAQNALGAMYEQNLKLPVNIKKALALYRAAARQGDALGLNGVAGLYQVGFGVKRNPLTAYTLCLTALEFSKGNRDIELYANVTMRELTPHLRKGDVERAKAIAAAWAPGRPLLGLQ